MPGVPWLSGMRLLVTPSETCDVSAREIEVHAVDEGRTPILPSHLPPSMCIPQLT